MLRAMSKGAGRCLLIFARSSFRDAFFRTGLYSFKPNVRRALSDGESTNNATTPSRPPRPLHAPHDPFTRADMVNGLRRRLRGK